MLYNVNVFGKCVLKQFHAPAAFDRWIFHFTALLALNWLSKLCLNVMLTGMIG